MTREKQIILFKTLQCEILIISMCNLKPINLIILQTFFVCFYSIYVYKEKNMNFAQKILIMIMDTDLPTVMLHETKVYCLCHKLFTILVKYIVTLELLQAIENKMLHHNQI